MQVYGMSGPQQRRASCSLLFCSVALTSVVAMPKFTRLASVDQLSESLPENSSRLLK